MPPTRKLVEGAPLPLDEKCLYGTLSNGMTYYVQTNKKPEARAELRLVVKIGSVHEEEHECGLAHMVEHLAFRGTAQYNTFEVVRFLEAIGARFGACQNAYTAFDETVYFLQVPIDKPGLLEKALTVLHEWAFHVRCTDEDVEAERGIVLEEWRQGRTAHGRTDEDFFRTLMDGSTYARRLPIGKVDVIRNCRPETVRGFYQKWYHPKRMAVMAVGDFEAFAGGALQVAEQIVRLFDKEAPRPWVEAPLPVFPAHDEPRLSIFCDSEATNASVVVDCKRERQPVDTEGDYKRTILEHLFHEALSSRLYKVAVSPMAPFFSASTSISFPTSIVETCALAISVQEGGELSALECVLAEVERVSAHGFTEAELRIAKANLMSDLEADHIEKEQLESEGFCSEFVEHFCRREPAMGVAYEVELCKALLPDITCEQVASVVKDYTWERNCVVKITRPKASWFKKLLGSGGQDEITEREIKGVVERVLRGREALVPWEQSSVLSFSDLLSPPPPKGSVVEKRHFERSGVTELMLSNGLRVCYKKTRFLDDEVQFKACAFGGLSEVAGGRREDLVTCRMSMSIAGEVGAFGVPPGELVDMLAGMRVSVNTEIAMYTRAICGECSPSDLESALQMMHLLFTCRLKPTEEQLHVLLRMLREQVDNQWRSPQMIFAQRVLDVNTDESEFFKQIRPTDIQKIDTAFACAFFRHCFCDPSEFTLTLSGNLDEQTLIKNLEKHLGSIPVLSEERRPTLEGRLPKLPRKRQDLTPLAFKFPAKAREEHIRMAMVDPLCCTKVTLPIRIPCGERELQETFLVTHALQVLESRLVERMRFELGAIYNVSAAVDFGAAHPRADMPLEGTAGISFTCHPRDVSQLVKSVFAELEALRAEGPTLQDVMTRVEISRREHETSTKYNTWWVERISSAYSSRHASSGGIDETLTKIEGLRQRVLESLSPEELQGAYRRHFGDLSRYTVVTLRPSLSTQILSALRLRMTESESSAALLVAAGAVAVGITVVAAFACLRALRWGRGGR
mmetsp:Transcript_2475/g.5962  ORF Transcript_2475/g.5962 Transcript_2475/m.5962 type:complete len:1024 (+) Transcript_2475:179-3250(+)